MADSNGYTWLNPPEGEGSTDSSPASSGSMETGSSSKKSKSRPEHQRGPKRQERKRERAKQHYERLGLEFKSKEQLRLEQAERATGRAGCYALEMHSALLESAANEPCPDGEEKEQQIINDLLKEIPVDMHRWIQMVHHEPRCVICDKVAAQGHIESIEHLKKMRKMPSGQ